MYIKHLEQYLVHSKYHVSISYDTANVGEWTGNAHFGATPKGSNLATYFTVINAYILWLRNPTFYKVIPQISFYTGKMTHVQGSPLQNCL